MIFAQVPFGDVIIAFIGLWLVPWEKVKVRGQGQQWWRSSIIDYTWPIAA